MVLLHCVCVWNFSSTIAVCMLCFFFYYFASSLHFTFLSSMPSPPHFTAQHLLYIYVYAACVYIGTQVIANTVNWRKWRKKNQQQRDNNVFIHATHKLYNHVLIWYSDRAIFRFILSHALSESESRIRLFETNSRA